MSSAQYGERGGVTALRATPALQHPNTDRTRSSNHPTLNSKKAWFRDDQQANANHLFRSANISPDQSLEGPFGDPAVSSTTKNDALDIPSNDTISRSSLLRDAVFPDWKDASGDEGFESPEEMKKKDPLGTQIWKLYSRTKTRLPNQERMENLTWRMMAMNLRRREQQNKILYVLSTFHVPHY